MVRDGPGGSTTELCYGGQGAAFVLRGCRENTVFGRHVGSGLTAGESSKRAGDFAILRHRKVLRGAEGSGGGFCECCGKVNRVVLRRGAAVHRPRTGREVVVV